MAQTFKDFVVECEMYPYSKENFEIMKECEEISLLSKMLENHYVLQELALDSVQFESTSYMTEYTQPIEVIEESVKDKITSLINKVKMMFAHLLDVITRFLTKRSDNIKTKVGIAKAAEQLASNPEQMKKLAETGKLTWYDRIKLKVGKVLKKEPSQKSSLPRTATALITADNIIKGVKYQKASADSYTGGTPITEGYLPDTAVGDITKWLKEYAKFNKDESGTMVLPYNAGEVIPTSLAALAVNMYDIAKDIKTGRFKAKDNLESEITKRLTFGGENKVYYYRNHTAERCDQIKKRFNEFKAAIEDLQKEAETARKESTGPEFAGEFEAKARAYATLLSVATKYFGKLQKIEAEIEKELRVVDKFIKANTEALEAKEA